jgi:acetyltransferase-like isoleucine patch superfamily enzyme
MLIERVFSKIRRFWNRSADRDAALHFVMANNPTYSAHSIGRYSYGYPIVLWADKSKNAQLSIGSFCSFAGNVQILLGGNHRSDWLSTFPFMVFFPSHANHASHSTSKGAVTIGNDVWVAQDAMILSGITIGDGAVIGARCVVTKDVPPYAIVAGNPGRVVKMRFSDDVISQLLAMQWWDWPIEKISRCLSELMSGEIGALRKAAAEFDKGEECRPNAA